MSDESKEFEMYPDQDDDPDEWHEEMEIVEEVRRN